MRKKLLLTCAAAVAALLALSATPAQAAGAVLTYGSLGGTAVPVGHVIQSNLKTGTTATFYSTAAGTTGVTCTASSFSGTVLTNPGAGGVATESVTAHSFSSCTSNIPGTTCVQSIAVNNLPYSASVNGTTKAITITGSAAAPIQTTIKLCTLLGTVTCVYRADLNTVAGATSNTDNSITFTSQKFNRFSGPGTCFANGYFTAKYAPVRDTSVAAAPLVYVQ
ncbi:Tat pathway signal sequence domain protein [Catellatospora sp. KI3]|uniref:Tat pathway signal sequence domain protein n=1 Tax=Catellatospora sp. KI3 TaxID=3041620 RepID=UPI0024825035|nr:Tat pathway signal sequence domain protein [Catellatospora sp. KI3]MDI1462880.1 Tat pathway signal sequence domain protein [Catellatospora sp. KI3]